MRIGLVLNILDEEYQISVYKGLKKTATELGVSLVCFQLENERIKNGSLVKKFPTENFFNLDGIILLTSVLMDNFELRTKADIEKIWGNIPVVSVGQEIDGVPSFTIQADDSMKQLVEHLLLEHKYRKFVFLSGVQNHHDTIMREKIFIQTMNAYKPWFPELRWDIKKGLFTEAAAIHVMEEYFQSNPDSSPDVVVCANDNMAIGVYKFFKIHNDNPKIRPCAVTGFDDIPQAKFEIPSLTTIHQPLEEIGNAALAHIVEMIKSGIWRPENKFIESKVIFRHSCGCKDESELEKLEKDKVLEQIQYNYVHSEQLLRMVSHIGQDLNSVETLEGMNGVIISNTEQLEIDNFCVLRFAHKVSIDNFELEKIKIHPIFVRKKKIRYCEYFENREMTIGEFYREYYELGDKESFSLVFKQLYSGNEVVGFVLYDAANNLLPYLCSIAINIAQTLSRIESFEEKKRHSEYLEKEVSKRTEELMEANNKRMAVEAEVLRISELERQRFSTDLHDDICQRLAGISMLCRSYANQNESVEKSQMVELAQLISDTLQTTRQYAHNSYPVELESLGMNHAVNNLVDSFGKQMGIPYTYEWELDNENNLNKLQKLNIFRIIQESLHNVAKHAKAKSVSVIIKAVGKSIVIQISDDGCGITRRGDNKHQGLGLNSMQYRANQIGATFKIKNRKPSGTTIEVKL